MPKSSHYKGNNEGGYGNPPVKDQFDGKPGPGRPKGSKSLDGALRKVFRKKVVRIDKNGKRTFIDAPEALADRLLELGLKGPLAANIEARAMAAKFGSTDDLIELDLSRLNKVELQLYGYICTRLADKIPEAWGPELANLMERIGHLVEMTEQQMRKKRRANLPMPRPRPTAIKRDPLDEYLEEDEAE